jgi:hypothetical protein
MSEGEGDEVNCCPIAARTDSTHRPHLATTGISGYKKCFTGLEVMLRRGVELCRAGACCCERMSMPERLPAPACRFGRHYLARRCGARASRLRPDLLKVP